MQFAPAQYRIENGYLVGYAPWLDMPVRTKLRRVAKRLAMRGDGACGALLTEHFRILDGMTPEQITTDAVGALIERDAAVGGLWSKIKKGAKKAAKGIKKAVVKTVQLAHKVTHNKAFEKVHKSIQNMVPEPFKIFVKVHNQFADKTHAFIEGMGKGDKKRKALAPAIRDAAKGLIDKKRLTELAKKAGVDPEEAEAVAAATKLQNMAKAGDRKAAATISVMDMLDKMKEGKPGAATRFVADADIRARFPGAKSYLIKGQRTGKKFHTIVIPAAA